MKNRNKQQGFTLVELSIVLVIIGLIVSGILVGQDMIRAAEIRSTVSQMEQYNTAVNTFRDKYRNIPGDMSPADAARFGFINTPARAGTVGAGDGNRLLEANGTGTAASRAMGFETGLFWRDLSQANLIGNSFVTATSAFPAAAVTSAAIKDWLPEASIGQGHYITIHAQNGRNYFSVSQVTGAAVTTGAYALSAAMTPQTAFNIDDKMDDGNPTSGIVNGAFDPATLGVVFAATTVANESIQIPVTATTGAGACAFSTAAGVVANSVYNTATDALANRPSCQLRVRTSF